MREIVIRGFANEKFNTTFGKGLFRRAVFNGSVELGGPNQKYLVDFYEYNHWANLAKTPNQIATINNLIHQCIQNQASTLLSWLMHYDPLSKVKTPTDGFCVYLPKTQELYIQIDDPTHQTQDEWTLNVHHCKTTGINKPVFIATNIALH